MQAAQKIAEECCIVLLLDQQTSVEQFGVLGSDDELDWLECPEEVCETVWYMFGSYLDKL